MPVRDSITAVVGRLTDALERSGEVYAYGGALALAAWSEPRATADVDVVTWVLEDRFDVERMVQVRGSDLDRAFVRAALVEMLDWDDRIERWDEIYARNQE